MQSNGLAIGARWKDPTAVSTGAIFNGDEGDEVRIPFRPGFSDLLACLGAGPAGFCRGAQDQRKF